jgi:hypothetical protein
LRFDQGPPQFEPGVLTTCDEGMIMYNKFERKGKEAVIAIFRVLVLHFPVRN